MKVFTIKRSKWARAGINGESELKNSEGGMCCLGFYLNSCRVSQTQLLGHAAPENVQEFIPKQAKWLLTDSQMGYHSDSSDSNTLMLINDKSSSENVREDAIAKMFAAHGVKVNFTD